ncbi:MAG: hypothetical protein U0746_22055 [Gemmataceae bacterium]
MSLTGDRYVGTYEGHTVELVRNNWVKTLTLRIDGQAVATQSCVLPGRITLAGTLDHNGVRHAVVARSVPRRVLWTDDTVEVDGRPLALDKTL